MLRGYSLMPKCNVIRDKESNRWIISLKENNQEECYPVDGSAYQAGFFMNPVELNVDYTKLEPDDFTLIYSSLCVILDHFFSTLPDVNRGEDYVELQALKIGQAIVVTSNKYTPALIEAFTRYTELYFYHVLSACLLSNNKPLKLQRALELITLFPDNKYDYCPGLQSLLLNIDISKERPIKVVDDLNAEVLQQRAIFFLKNDSKMHAELFLINKRNETKKNFTNLLHIDTNGLPSGTKVPCATCNIQLNTNNVRAEGGNTSMLKTQGRLFSGQLKYLEGNQFQKMYNHFKDKGNLGLIDCQSATNNIILLHEFITDHDPDVDCKFHLLNSAFDDDAVTLDRTTTENLLPKARGFLES